MNICVFCSIFDVAERYTQPTRELAKLFAQGGHTLVWGGSDRGLMKLMADGVQMGGGKVIGISTELVKEQIRQNADELIMTKDLAGRKAMMLERSDAFVVLPGATGTLDEFAEILALKRHQMHNKPIVVLNSAGFYDGLKAQFEKMEQEGFVAKPILGSFVQFADTPEDAMRYIEGYDKN